MSPVLLLIVVALAGGVGAIARFVLDGLIRDRLHSDHPLGTMIINLSGSFVLGVLAGLTVAGLRPEIQTVAGTGFCGGYTTFSTACLETVRLIQQRRWAAATLHGLGTLALAGGLALIGLLIGASSR